MENFIATRQEIEGLIYDDGFVADTPVNEQKWATEKEAIRDAIGNLPREATITIDLHLDLVNFRIQLCEQVGALLQTSRISPDILTMAAAVDGVQGICAFLKIKFRLISDSRFPYLVEFLKKHEGNTTFIAINQNEETKGMGSSIRVFIEKCVGKRPFALKWISEFLAQAAGLKKVNLNMKLKNGLSPEKESSHSPAS